MPPPPAHTTLENPKSDSASTQTSKSFDFAAGYTDVVASDYSKTGRERSNLSSRSRPRLVKMRRKQMVAPQNEESWKIDLGLNGFSDVNGGVKFDAESASGNVFGGIYGKSGSDESAKTGDLNGNVEQPKNGLGFGASLNDCFFAAGLGNGKSLFGSGMNSSRSNSQSRKGDFLFASHKGSSNLNAPKETKPFVFGVSTANQNFPGGSFVFDPNTNELPMDAKLETEQFGFAGDANKSAWNSNFSAKDSRENLRRSNVHDFQVFNNTEFVFGSGKYDCASPNIDQQDSVKSRLHSSADEFGKVDGGCFVFGANKAAVNSDPQKQDCNINVDKTESNKDAGNAVPDMRGKVKLDASGDSENCMNFVFGFNNSDSKLGINLESNPTDKNRDTFKFTSRVKENAEIENQFQNACLNDAFVFGGLKGKGGFDSGGSTTHVSVMSQLNRGKAEDSNGSKQQNIHNAHSDINPKFQSNNSSCGTFEKGPTASLSNEMKKLNIGHVDKTEGFTSNVSVNHNVFVFGNVPKDTGFPKENHPVNKGEATPDLTHLPQDNSEPDGSSSLFASVGIGVQLNASMNRDEKDSNSFTSKLAGVDSSLADHSTPSMAFAFSNGNLFPGIDKKLGSANSKSLRGKRSKKRNGNLRQRAVSQQLFSQDCDSKEGSSQQNESPGCGSPMDFSPYQNTSASNAPEADISSGVKGEFGGKNVSEHREKPHDDESNSKFSFSFSAQEGLSALRRQYKKKYKLKVSSNQAVQGNDSDKENAKREPIGTATDELCDHWRARGNQAYHAGKLSKAEEFYSIGINSGAQITTSGYSMKPLLLCYSNRAATRMSLGRMREAIEDCTKAAELDPNFPKATFRAGNCYLVLGEVEDAIQCYTKCLSSETAVCLDRRITIEAASGLQKAKRVAEYMLKFAELLQEGTDDAASSALEKIAEALAISRYSERLLKMKGEALCILRKYDEVIQLCEQTLDIALKNIGSVPLDDPSCNGSHVKLWRWHLQIKSHYRLGRLDTALDLFEKQEKISISSKSGDVTQESSIALAATMRELLCLKRSGNEAFNSGRYTEAIESYTSAISKSSESRPYMAICFCNRAAAYQSISQIIDAIADCSVAIALDDNYEKAISRRATLHEMIRDYKQAAYDLERLISLLENRSQTKTQQNGSQSKSNGGSVRDLRKARRHLSLVEEKAKKETPLDLYLILGIKASDAESEIKKAYRKAALRHHPDKAGQVLVRSDVGDDGTLWKECGEKIHKDADRLFKIIGEAYAVLSDPSKRSKYDHEEEMRNLSRDSNRNSNSGHASTSYSSPHERGRQSGFSTSFERNRQYWNEFRAYQNSHSRW